MENKKLLINILTFATIIITHAVVVLTSFLALVSGAWFYFLLCLGLYFGSFEVVNYVSKHFPEYFEMWKTFIKGMTGQ
jgi:hypothetical protein